MQKKRFVFYLTAISLLVSGCSAKMVKPLTGYQRLESQSFKINNSKYASLENFCQVYSLDWQWKGVSQHIFLTNSSLDISIRCGSLIAVVNGQVGYLSVPPLMKKGRVIVPLELAKSIDAICVFKPAAEKVFKIKVIVIDPGHGGKDPGAVGRYGLREKDVVFDIALEIKKLLERENIKAVMTRDKDEFVSLWKRTSIANTSKADFFISIHANASNSRQANGFEVYCLSDNIDGEARAVMAAENNVLEFEKDSLNRRNIDLDATLCDLVYKENQAGSNQMADILCETVSAELKSKNRGVKDALFYVLKGVSIPAVLIEVGFVSNGYEESKLKSAEYKKQLADTIVKGILIYKNEFENTNGFTN